MPNACVATFVQQHVRQASTCVCPHGICEGWEFYVSALPLGVVGHSPFVLLCGAVCVSSMSHRMWLTAAARGVPCPPFAVLCSHAKQSFALVTVFFFFFPVLQFVFFEFMNSFESPFFLSVSSFLWSGVLACTSPRGKAMLL